MRKITLYTLFAFLIFGSGAIVFADTSDQTDSNQASTTRANLIQKIKNLVEAKKEVVKEDVVSGIKGKIASTTTRVAEDRFTNMTKRYLAVIDRESAIMTKIISRIAKIKLNGGNTATAEGFVTQAKTQLTEARIAYDTLNTLVVDTENASTTKQTLISMRNSVNSIDKYLRGAHQLLQKSVGSLRGVSQLHNSTSTNEN